jgi:hypothetical protein
VKIFAKSLKTFPLHDLWNSRNSIWPHLFLHLKGRLSFKQYLPAKPTKFGIKKWERASLYNGYCHEFQVYTGKKEGQGREDNLGSRVDKDLTRKITDKGHHVIFLYIWITFFKSNFI